MFKKFALSAMVLLGVVAMPNAFAKNASSGVNEVDAVQVTTTYEGTMSVVMGTSSSSIQHTTEATPRGSNVDLFIENFSVGRMPAYIEVDAKNVIADGIARTYSNVVRFTFKGSSTSIYFSAEITVTAYDANTLVYTINVLEAEYQGAPFIATVNFNGTAL
ncbi:calycin-like domain-containing protein [Limibacterium fermenti]|jgi:hypothetical protein|uniref:calycin-like domain-containing protein n=1 Tax=Limibacterium fermenti TaxID=3229863 RepID=UPI000E9E357B|nr:hypothetical protein [Porphyromonadaceae bacterium]HBX44305.1 hypothetical protein [Porphyromonadaceae bacterium]HCM20074.1 hypothetical protein [Porphyromonadaceae bacterium]